MPEESSGDRGQVGNIRKLIQDMLVPSVRALEVETRELNKVCDRISSELDRQSGRIIHTLEKVQDHRVQTERTLGEFNTRLSVVESKVEGLARPND